MQCCDSTQCHPRPSWISPTVGIIHWQDPEDLGLTPTTHEPCLYSGEVDGERVLFLRQVDDFAFASKHKCHAGKLIDDINNKKRIQVKHLGLIDKFNDIDIQQTHHYIKIICSKYLQKVVTNHQYLLTNPVALHPVSIHVDPVYLK